MDKKFFGLLIGGLVLATASPALAAGPAAVTVRVESGGSAQLAPTAVTTSTTPVNKDGTHDCSGTSAAGALQTASAGDWSGAWSSGFGSYGVERIKSEDYGGFSPSAPYYWGFAINQTGADTGVCGAELQPGDEVLFYRACNAATSGCYPYDAQILGVTGPTSVKPGEAFTVTVTQVATSYDSNGKASGTRTPAAGAQVYAGSQHAVAGADGKAVLNVPERGPVGVRVTSGDKNVPGQYALCVTDGADGACGTQAPQAAAPCVTTGDDGRCGTPDKRAAYGFITSLKDGQRFARGKGPRELTGRTDADASGIKDIRLRLTRNDRGACARYDGTREAWVTTKGCGAARGTWSSIGSRSDWRYLLPAKLARGRYVLDVQVVDQAGNADDKLARGRNRVVFTVG